MIATNIRVYSPGISQIKEVIRLRFCPKCHAKERDRWTTAGADGRSLEWDNILRSADEILADEGLLGNCRLLNNTMVQNGED
jgi:hypothetical protein